MNEGNKELRQEQKAAIRIVWGIISSVTTLVIAIALFANSQTILDHAPQCVSKSQLNVDCPFCGMTRAFINIGKGNFQKAYNLNRGSLALFFAFLFNSLIFFIFELCSIYKVKRQKNLNKVKIQFIHKTILK